MPPRGGSSPRKRERERGGERDRKKEKESSSFSRMVFSPWESAKWSAVPIITSSFYGNNAEVTRHSPKDIEREKITRADDSRWNVGGREK